MSISIEELEGLRRQGEVADGLDILKFAGGRVLRLKKERFKMVNGKRSRVIVF
jgi:hypothetical protein